MVRYAQRAFGAPVLYSDDGTYFPIIGGVPYADATNFIEAGSLQIQRTIGKRSSASFTLHTSTATHFAEYTQVQIYDGTTNLLFSGYMVAPKDQKPGFQPSLDHPISCIDQHYLADKRRITASYINKTCGYIVQDIMTRILASEGVTRGQIYDGLTPSETLYPSDTLYPGGTIGLIPSINFIYEKVSDAFDRLAKAASTSGIPYYWQIDELKQLWFVPYTTIINSTLVDGTQVDQVRSTPVVTRSNPKYRNTQYVIGGIGQTVTQFATRKGDGNSRDFAMGFPLASKPSLTVNGVAKTVGIKGVDTGKDWYWSKGDPMITQDSGATILISTDTLIVTYIGQYPNVALASNDAQVAYQASVDGTSGIVEDVISDTTLTSASDGLAEAGQELAHWAMQGAQLVFTTLTAGFDQGQLITVDLPDYGLHSVEMLIESVSSSDQLDQFNIWHTITCVSGPYDTTWVDFFSTLLKNASPIDTSDTGISQNTTILQQFTASATATASLNVSVYTCPLPSTSLFPSTTLYPC